MLLLHLSACQWLLAPAPLELPPPSSPTRPTAADLGGVYSFVRHGDDADIDLPDTNRPGGEPAPDAIALQGSFRTERGGFEGQQIYAIPLPIHDNLLPTRTEGTHFFGSECPPGLEVVGPDGPLKFRKFGRAKPDKHVFGFDREWLYIGLDENKPAPSPGDYTLRFPKATKAENALNFGLSGQATSDFVVRTQTVGEHSHAGLYLPAPAQATWEGLVVPERGTVGFRAQVLPPAIAQPVGSDGATVIVEVVAGGKLHELARQPLEVGSWARVRADLSAFAGQAVDVRFRTEAGASPVLDYVFLEAPTLYPASDDPRRFLLVFVDTLRPDHLGMYGYERPTSPNLDAWAEHGARFTSARSIAPWTLPSARAMLTGRQPELFYEGPRVQDLFAEAGWRTEAFLTNAFLSQPFDIHHGWDHFHYEHLGEAEAVVERAVEALHAWPDRDTFVMVHFMEPHIPYREGRYHRSLFEPWSRPDELQALTRKFLVTVDESTPNYDGIRSYVTDRYDQNIRAVDDALVPLLEAAGPDATTVLVSDHGEELWDHGGFEHGHTFYDELLRVPLVVRSPHVPAGVVEEPVSLLDITPTLLELAGLPVAGEVTGTSLVGLAWGEAEAKAGFAARPHGFGRPLYGDNGWGVVSGGAKFWDRAGDKHHFDVANDPGEAADLYGAGTDEAAFRQALEASLGREVRRAWKVSLTSPELEREQVIRFTHPAGFVEAALEYDPRGRLEHAIPEIDAESAAVVAVPAGKKVPSTVLLYPADEGASAQELQVFFDERSFGCPRPKSDDVLCISGGGEQRMVVEGTWAPVPRGVEVSGFHPDVEEQLRELGYLDD
jgi:arylsulfatase A-like enzyme